MRIEVTPDKFAENISILVYGTWGSGKTHFAGTAQDVLYLDFEKGYATLANLPFRGKVFVLETVQDLVDVLKVLEKPEEIEREFGFRPRAIAIDTLTRMQEMEIISILDANPSRPPALMDVLDQREWGVLLNRMLRVIKLLPSRGFDIIALCQARELENPSDKKQIWYPNLRGQFGDQIGAFFDLVGFLEVRQEEPSRDEVAKLGRLEALKRHQGKLVRRLYFKPVGGFVAKTRFGHMPDFVDNPTFELIKKLVRREVSKDAQIA